MSLSKFNSFNPSHKFNFDQISDITARYKAKEIVDRFSDQWQARLQQAEKIIQANNVELA